LEGSKGSEGLEGLEYPEVRVLKRQWGVYQRRRSTIDKENIRQKKPLDEGLSFLYA
jgi:hypothetical protein